MKPKWTVAAFDASRTARFAKPQNLYRDNPLLWTSEPKEAHLFDRARDAKWFAAKVRQHNPYAEVFVEKRAQCAS